MISEARKRATENYRKKSNIKVFQIRFYPDDHDLYEKLMEKGKTYVSKDENGKNVRGGVAEYVRDLLRKDLGMNGE